MIQFGLSAAALLMVASAAQADLSVTFIEGAPKDRFEIQNTGECALKSSTVTLDLAGSQGALIFDVTASGAGVEVFQPFEVVEGQGALSALPTVIDGQTAVALSINTLAPGEAVAFTIDVDDTIGAREITVTGSEIAGATVTHEHSSGSSTATFSSSSSAFMALSTC